MLAHHVASELAELARTESHARDRARAARLANATARRARRLGDVPDYVDPETWDELNAEPGAEVRTIGKTTAQYEAELADLRAELARRDEASEADARAWTGTEE